MVGFSCFWLQQHRLSNILTCSCLLLLLLHQITQSNTSLLFAKWYNSNLSHSLFIKWRPQQYILFHKRSLGEPFDLFVDMQSRFTWLLGTKSKHWTPSGQTLKEHKRVWFGNSNKEQTYLECPPCPLAQSCGFEIELTHVRQSARGNNSSPLHQIPTPTPPHHDHVVYPTSPYYILAKVNSLREAEHLM